MNRNRTEQDGVVFVCQRPNKRMKRPDPSDGLRSPRFQDVLCGRGGKSNKWPGNVIFRQIVQRNKDHYQCTEMPHHKGFIVVSIIEAIHRQCPAGRFLRFDKASNSWQEISRKEAFSKTSQALREQEARKPEQTMLEPLVQLPTAAAATLVPLERVESRIDLANPPPTVAFAKDTATTLACLKPSLNFTTIISSRDTKRPLYGVPSRVPLEDDDDDDTDSVVCEFDKEFDYSRDSRLGKALAAGARPLQVHIGIPYTPCRQFLDDDSAAIISTGQHSNGRSSGSEDNFDDESVLEDETYGIPPLPGCKMRAPSMTELLQREDSLAFENAIFQI